ncbi:MAG TPA: class I SAM-dependent RNA methyltransferase [Candidatus Nitrosotalea sp.]|nr:class I SAM-dependent RNA methyltransferase [Candidatus Nitrosotalea sp.]
MIVDTGGVAHGGAVIAHDDQGRTLLVHHALPQERVLAEPGLRRAGVVHADAIEILTPSADRVPAPCPHFGVCGGCSWQHARYPAQLELKLQVVTDAWRRAGLRLPPGTTIAGMDNPWRYRIRGEFEAIGEGGEIEFGFHRARSHRAFSITTCPLHDERIERALFAFRDALRESGVRGVVNLLLSVEPTGHGLLWRLRRRGPVDAQQQLDLAGRVAERLPDLVLLDDSMSLEFFGLTFRVRSDTFIQTNYEQMLVLYRTALGMLGARPQERILDLYAGIGTLALSVAQAAARVTAVEENPAAAQLSLLSARINAVKNFNALPGRVESVLKGVRLGSYEAALIDPPRAGCERAAIAELIRLGLERLVYVSCEPSTHARDLALLVQGGYRVRRAALVDMFPQTYHIETVALLERA